MPKQKKSSKKRDLNNRKPNAGLAALRKVLQGITPVPGVTPDLSRPASGFLSQVMGSDDEGNVGFTLSNPFLPKEKRKTLGLVDEILSIPTLIELFGIQSPEFATEASERTDFLRNAIREDMGLSEPEGFAENAAESAGVMLGQLPIPSKKKVEVGVGAAKGLRAMLKKILGSGPEFFSPTVDPKLSNYASGAGFGGALGMLGDEPPLEPPPLEEFAQGGLVPAGTDLESLRRRFQELMQGGGGGMATSTVAPTQASPPPPGPTIVKFPDELIARRRQRPDAKLSELFNYGAGPEFNNFFVDPTFGTPNPDAPPLRVPFSRPARTPAAPISVPTDRVYTSGSRLTANLNNPIMELRRRLGKAEGGMVSDPIDDVLQVAGRNLMGLTRNIRMARGGKVNVLKMATGGKVSSFLSGVKSLRNDGKVGYSEAVDHFIKKDNPTVQELQEMVIKFKKTPEQIMKRLDQRRKVISSYQPMKIEDSLNYYPDLARRILDNGGSEDDIKNMTMPAKKKAALIAAFRNEMGEGKN